jgi:hypothetical protein
MKQRKVLMRQVKTDGVMAYLQDQEHGYLVLAKMLSSIDDIGNLNKYVLSDL